ncbi:MULTISPECIES: DUF1854 domain-containing protein [unclassified Achromobacter]|jgi:hypothetical protein|uniref:cyanophycin metabolism-associated DUF1854 family protein n=1 Tax=unclassified Achromobacter TaxID=2626865 RepID=UPI000B51C45B|nr:MULTISPECIES: DUF1854 domain-containing protein [unclassified Achromobacter]OWT70327.1 hypothetical protein CEY05_27235 [Achromobacter sp. HZ34]OWT71867.1 hypothetical protein CEY04_26070 [Achromobacter sp. HZ28]
MSSNAFTLHRNAQGRLVHTGTDGVVREGVLPVRAFPISDPDRGLSLVDAEGHEIVWIERLEDLPADIAALLREELASREFMPEIQRIVAVQGYATPSSWDVMTDRGPTTFVLRGEEDIRRLGAHTLLIADSHGIHYLVRDLSAMDKPSRKLLDRFL